MMRYNLMSPPIDGFILLVDDASPEGGYGYTTDMIKIRQNMEALPDDQRRAFDDGIRTSPEAFGQVYHYGLYICVAMARSNTEGKMYCFHRDFTPVDRNEANAALEAVLPSTMVEAWWKLFDELAPIPSEQFDKVRLVVV